MTLTEFCDQSQSEIKLVRFHGAWTALLCSKVYGDSWMIKESPDTLPSTTAPFFELNGYSGFLNTGATIDGALAGLVAELRGKHLAPRGGAGGGPPQWFEVPQDLELE
jgi:hypothetical protein